MLKRAHANPQNSVSSLKHSRLHWALMEKDSVTESWDSGHLGEIEEESEANHNVADGMVAKGIPLPFITASAQDRLLGEGATIRSVSAIVHC